ncbi:hypothetical protein AB6E94_19695 [Vibrio lentus]|uniref:hypothetical protein n=1 Tax=Vibrio splendidus TaxID=29497 RepID=UPI000C8490AE|nr:hypothetical protein [Vibrio splendidus]PMG17930.1 hypothetical protein BCU98_00930 [Vibrio splendidus]
MNRFGSKLLIAMTLLALPITVSAGEMAYREHLLNARAHLEQAIKALDRAENAKAPNTRHTYSTSKGKEYTKYVIDGIDYYFQTPLQPQFSPEQFGTEQ